MRAYTRLIQLQGPLAGAFLKNIPMNGMTFWNSEWTALSRFRFGIPLSSALSSAAKWGDEAVDKHGDGLPSPHLPRRSPRCEPFPGSFNSDGFPDLAAESEEVL